MCSSVGLLPPDFTQLNKDDLGGSPKPGGQDLGMGLLWLLMAHWLPSCLQQISIKHLLRVETVHITCPHGARKSKQAHKQFI